MKEKGGRGEGRNGQKRKRSEQSKREERIIREQRDTFLNTVENCLQVLRKFPKS
jgi:hypothetical protein